MSHGIDDNITKVLHYDGVSWREVPFPAGETPSRMTITDIAAVSGRLWLIGQRGTPAVIQEWDGTVWRSHQPPSECVFGGSGPGDMPNFCNFAGITAFSQNDIWVAGNGSWSGFAVVPLERHVLAFSQGWHQWTTARADVGQREVVARPVGRWQHCPAGRQHLVVHGDGKTWETVAAPKSLLPGVAVDNAGNPCVIQNFPPEQRSTLATYDRGWIETPVPLPAGTVAVSMKSIAAVPGSDVMFAVGTADLPTSPRKVQAVVMRRQ